MTEYTFKKIIYSGTCICGHSWEDHHLGMVMNEEALKIIGPYIPQECEYFGCNEDGGLDSDGNDHCFGYLDKDSPDTERINKRLSAIKLSVANDLDPDLTKIRNEVKLAKQESNDYIRSKMPEKLKNV